MNADKIDFYLTLTDGGGDDTAVRRCRCLRRVANSLDMDMLLVRIDPPVLDHNRPREEIIVAARYAGRSVFSLKRWSLFSFKRWPMEVFLILFTSDDARQSECVTREDIMIACWARLHRTEAAARADVHCGG